MRGLVCCVLLCWLSVGVSNTPTKKGRETIYRPASHAATLSRPVKVRAPVTPKKVVSEHVTITEVPQKKVDPTCVHPKTLGFPSVTTCADLLTVGSLERGLIWLQSGLSSCTFMNDLSCDDGSGAGLEQYRKHLQGKGYNSSGDVGADRLGALGDCLKVSKRANGDYDIANAIRGEVLCCRVTCDSPAAPVTTVETALLPLDEDPMPVPTPVTTITTSAPQATPLGITSPMCILPGFLDLPRVRTCEDLKDVAASTDYLSLTSSSLLECDWVQDLSCNMGYPGYGIALGSGRPNGSCIALRQGICDTNVIGAWPLLARHFRGLCKLPAPTTQTITAVTMPTKKGHTNNRALRPKDASATAAPARRLAGGSATMQSASDSLLVCCRLDCNGGLSSNTHTSQPLPTQEVAYQAPMAPAPTVVLGGSSGYPTGGYPTGSSSGGDTPKVAMAARDEIDLDDSLCNVRYAPICQLASPLRGERIVFDQNCLGANMPAGCFAGGLSRCCRSIPQ